MSSTTDFTQKLPTFGKESEREQYMLKLLSDVNLGFLMTELMHDKTAKWGLINDRQIDKKNKGE